MCLTKTTSRLEFYKEVLTNVLIADLGRKPAYFSGFFENRNVSVLYQVCRFYFLSKIYKTARLDTWVCTTYHIQLYYTQSKQRVGRTIETNRRQEED